MTVNVLLDISLCIYDFTTLACAWNRFHAEKWNHFKSGAFQKEWHCELKPLAPLAELQPQTRTDPPLCFTESWKHSFFHFSQTVLLTNCWRLEQKMGFSNSAIVWSFSILAFSPYYPSEKVVSWLPSTKSNMIKLLQTRRVNFASQWSCQILSQLLAWLLLISQRRNLSDFFFFFGFSYFFRLFPFDSGPAHAKLWFIAILWSLAFWNVWLKVGLISCYTITFRFQRTRFLLKCKQISY